MKFGAKWSASDIKPEARETAREAARRSGVPLGDWLNSVILRTAAQQGADPQAQHPEAPEDVGELHARINDLTRRIDQLTRRGPEAYAPPNYRPVQHAAQPHAPPLAFAPAPNLTNRLDSAVAEIAARRRVLNGEAAQPAPIAEAPELSPTAEPPPAIVRTPMPAQDLSGLEEQLRQITNRIDTLRTPGVEEAIHALRGELAQIRNSLNEAMPRQALDTIEWQIQNLAARIAEGREAGADGNALTNIEHGLAEVRDALYQLTPAENLAGFGEAIHRLDEKIDYIVAERDPATLQQLEQSITTLRQIAEHIASNEAVGRVASDVAMLAEKVDRLAGPAGDALSGLEQRIAALSDVIAARNENAATVPPRFEALLGSLADKVEKLQGSRSDDVAFGHLEDRIVKLVEKLDASDSRLTHLEAIERGLADLLVHIEEMRAQKPSGALRDNGNAAVDALKHDIARTQNEIEAVHGTLGQVVDRLATIEQGILNELRTASLQVPGELGARGVAAEPPAPPFQAAEQSAALAPQPLPTFSAPPVQPYREPVNRPMPQATSLPIDPDLPPDQPLEPGSGPPHVRLDPAARIAASEAALGGVQPSSEVPQSKSSFIAAARRAAQAAVKDKAVNARTPAAMITAEAGVGRDSLGKRLSKRVKSLFVSASVIAIVIGGFQIASTHFHLFPPGDQPDRRIGISSDGAPDSTTTDITHTAETPAPVQLPGLNLQGPGSGLLGSGGQSALDLTSPQSLVDNGDITGSLPLTQPGLGAPAAEPTGPGTVPNERIPVAIGSAKLREAAHKGDAGAAYEIAVRFAEGRGVPADLAEAARWFARAAATGLAPAQFRLGSLYEKGQGVKKDLDKARQNYLAAAAQGNGKAMHNLAVLYAEGIGNRPDFTSASKWFQKAAARGVADSQYNLAVLYARGLGVEKDLVESYKWFALAAAQGDKEAIRKRDEVAGQLEARALAAAKQTVKAWTAVPQPAVATTVPHPAGGWDADAPAAPHTAPKARAAAAPMKIGRR